MAISATHIEQAKGVVTSQWLALNKNSGATSGTALDAPHLPDKCVEVSGTFSGATLVIEGHNSSTATGGTYQTLNDSRGEGNALSFTAANIVQILENTRFIRPRLTTATGSPSLNVRIVSQSVGR
jgi:hypothetical protein